MTDIARFESLHAHSSDGGKTAWPGSPVFGDILSGIDAMATENKLALLNAAASCLELGEIYLEVGAYKGASIIGASVSNEKHRFLAIDNFSEFGGHEEECRSNIAAFGCTNVELVNADAFDVLMRGDVAAPIGVYFYDGAHEFESQWSALALVEPLLADRALVIVDDTSLMPARLADWAFASGRREWRKLFDLRSRANGDPEWWNGVQVFAYERQGSATRPTLWRHAAVRFLFTSPYELGRLVRARGVRPVRGRR
jgi:predicted O-methyltransferase YrrM